MAPEQTAGPTGGSDALVAAASTPQLNPAERLWPLVCEAVANWPVGRAEEVERAGGERCVTLPDHPARIHAATNYHWWPGC